MLKQDLVLPVVFAVKSAQELEAPKTGYTRPQLFAVARTVDLIQGAYWSGHARDSHNSYYWA